MVQAFGGQNVSDSAQINPGVIQGSDIADNAVVDANIGAHSSTKLTVRYIMSGTFANRPASPAAGQIYFATDTYQFFICYVAGTWKTYAGALIDEELTRGDILYRGASALTRLAAGTAGQFLKTNGAGADPAWASAPGVDKQVFTASGTWTKPAGAGANTTVLVELWGAGGGGNYGGSSDDGNGGGGGGGGAYVFKHFLASALGATETVTIDAGGAIATAGGNSTFGSLLTAYGGGGGGLGVTPVNPGGGGGGGGWTGAGANGVNSTPGAGGGFGGGAADSDASTGFGGGGGGSQSNVGKKSIYGGSGGSGRNATGATALYGGAGGRGGTVGSGNGPAGAVPAGGGGGSSYAATTPGTGGRGECRVSTFL